MMNEARLGVGVQGLGIAEIAYQNAVSYARDRIQGRGLQGTQAPDKPADPILVHPDVRRMLLTMRAMTEGCRALSALGGAGARRLRPPPGRRGARSGRRLRPADDADHQGGLHRYRLGRGDAGDAGLGRPRLYPRQRDGAVRPRRPHHPDLRGHQRHPGARPGRPQARRAWRALPAQLLPPGARLHRGAAGRAGDGGVHPAAGQGLRPAAAGDRPRSPSAACATPSRPVPRRPTTSACSA